MVKNLSEVYFTFNLHVSVDSVHLLNELVSADECNDYERVEGLLCGTVKQLRDNRSKPDQLIYLTLLNLARTRPNIFNSDIVIEVKHTFSNWASIYYCLIGGKGLVLHVVSACDSLSSFSF